MTREEQKQLLHAVRASLRSALGAVEHLMRRLEAGDARDDDDEGAEPSDLELVALALSDAAQALQPPRVPVRSLPPFPTSTSELAGLLAKYAPDGKARPA